MKCDDARMAMSVLADDVGVDGAGLDEHLGGCAACRAYQARLGELRRHFRFEPVEDVPDVTARVLAAVGGTRPRPQLVLVRVAAVFVAFAVAGAAFFGLAQRDGGRVIAADIPTRILEAQREIATLTADLAVVERGWHPAVPVREYRGSLAYVAPESLRLALADATAYPDASWVRNDTEYVASDGVLWWRGPAPCPQELQPVCTPPEPQVTALVAVEPFPDATPLPLDLVVPTASFTGSGMLRPLGEQVVAGRDAVGVEVTAAQLDPLLAGLRRAGNWREVHPADRVELWLDREALVPLALAVFPAPGEDRATWAARRGYADPQGVPVLEAAWRNLEIDAGVAAPFPSPPIGSVPADAGFRRADHAAPDVPVPGLLPDMQPHRAGIVRVGTGPLVGVRSWSDGRAWLKVAATPEWPGGRLFGDLGDVVRRVDVEGAGTVYVSDDGRRVAIHAAGADLVITGSVPPGQLLAAATSLGVTGQPVPAGWVEASSASLADAEAALPGLVAPLAPDGFGPPANRVDGGVATLTYAGPGMRGFVLVAAAGDLPPPLEADVRGVEVRGLPGRYSPERGILEWVEDGIAYSLRSAALSQDELVGIATDMRRP